jgi:AraC family transcriptional regulator
MSHKPTTLVDWKARMHKVLVYISNHADEALRVEDLAEVAGISPHHFHRIFSAMVGESVKSYVRRLKLERAAHDLVFTERSVTDIAFGSGYETPESFSRAFKSMVGESPSEYRKRMRREARGDRTQRIPVPYPFHFQDEGASRMEAEVKDFPTTKVAYVRHTGPYTECGEAWQKLAAWAGAKGLFGPETKFYGISWDDPETTPPEKVRFDACITVAETVEVEGEVKLGEIGGGAYLSTVHKGPYQRLIMSYKELYGSKIPEMGLEFRHAPSIEHYINSPDTTPADDLLTEIFVPVVSA